jgi:uncharacterized protein YkwD
LACPRPHAKASYGNEIAAYPRSAGSVSLVACEAIALLLLSFFAVALGTITASGASAGGAANDGSPATGSLGAFTRLELVMWQEVNQDRTSVAVQDETKGLAKPLVWDSRLAAVAREHSEEMAATGVLSHTGAGGSRPMNRVSDAGIHWLATGENIAKIDLGAGFAPVSEAVATEQVITKAEGLFMAEPRFEHNHRANILNPAYNHVGIGIARAADGSFYITQEFAQVR